MITIIHGGHRDGLCYNAAETFKRLLLESGTPVNLFNLRNHNFAFCCGDQLCQDSGACVYNDSITREIIPTIARSEALVFFTPTYFNMPPAILKSFLDRCNLLLTIEDRKHPRFGAWVSGQTESDSLEQCYQCLATFAEICELDSLTGGRISRF